VIRYVDMSKATDGLLTGFALWDTVHDRFMKDRYGDQRWLSLDGIYSGFGQAFADRVAPLIPQPPTPEREA
jgi:hypothetical protein